MKMREVVSKMCDMEGGRRGFCNTSDGVKEIEFDKEDLKMEADEKNVRKFADKYGMGDELLETVNTMKKMRGSKGIFHR